MLPDHKAEHMIRTSLITYIIWHTEIVTEQTKDTLLCSTYGTQFGTSATAQAARIAPYKFTHY